MGEKKYCVFKLWQCLHLIVTLCLQVPYSNLLCEAQTLKERVIDRRRDSEKTSIHQSLDTFFQDYYLALQRQPSSLLVHRRNMEAVAKYDFKATADDELSFKRGDILKVTDTLTTKHLDNKILKIKL